MVEQRGGKKADRRGENPPDSDDASKKKRKRRRRVGRPKKRGRKKGFGKKKSGKGFSSNNYNRIRKFIWEKNRSDFNAYADTAKIASEVYADCKFMQDCTPEDIQGLYEDRRSLKGRIPAEPEIAKQLYTQPQLYWHLADLPIRASSRFLWVNSPMLLAPPSEFLAIAYKYEATFREFVQWCNLQMRQKGIKDTNEILPMFILSKPVWSTDTKRWETEVYTCDSSGDRFDYGFVPTGDITGDGSMHLPGEEPEKVKPPDGIPLKTPPAQPEDGDAQKAEKQRIEIDHLRLKLKADQQKLEIEKLHADLDLQHKIERQKVEIDLLRLKIKVDEQKLGIEKLRADLEIRQGDAKIKTALRVESRKSIRLLEQSKKDLFNQIKEAKRLKLPAKVVDSLATELVNTITKLNELRKALD